MNRYIGLTSQKAAENIKQYGFNEIKKQKKRTFINVLINQFKDSTVYLLLTAGILSILLKEYVDSIIIFVVLIANGIIGGVQEYKAEKSLEALKKLSSPTCKVLRDNKIQSIEVNLVTIDDIVFLSEGDIVPADLLLLETNQLKIDESLLTGESVAVLKDATYLNKDKEALGDKLNYAYSSTKVISGNGVGRVREIGATSEIGKIADMLKEEESVTPLTLKLDKISKFLGIFTIALALLVFLIGILLDFNTLEILIFSISLSVAAIPEGLPAVVTIVLSLGVKKMVKEKAIVRRLPSVETLGSVEVICTDKTGTITKNQLEVKEIYSLSSDKDKLYENFVNNNNVKENIGDPVETSLLEYLKNNRLFSSKQRVRLKEIPFSSERKMMSVYSSINQEKILFSKGAFEVLINKCNRIEIENEIVSLSSPIRKELENKVLEMEEKAFRVLCFAYNNVDKEEDMIISGIVGFIDPPRENIQRSIEAIKNAGIDLVMITGDHKVTAYAIGKEVGIVSSIEECVDARELDSLLEEGKDIEKYKVFSRVNPSHKVKIVEYYKKKNKVVSMTGDGVNDAPSLKKADVGISMGNGSEVCKSTSDIILLDNNFKTIENAIKEGRNIFINIKKSVLFLLSSNLGEVLSVVVFLLLRLPLPLLSIHILWVNLISDSLPALALGSDSSYDDVMNDKPRKKDESIFSKNGYFIAIFYGLIIFLITSVSFLFHPISILVKMNTPINLDSIKLILMNENVLDKARTYAFTTLGVSQLFHMIGMSNIRENMFKILKHKNVIRVIAFIVGIFLQVLVTEVPFLIELFKTTRLEIVEWIWLIFISSLPLIFHELIRKSYKTGL